MNKSDSRSRHTEARYAPQRTLLSLLVSVMAGSLSLSSNAQQAPSQPEQLGPATGGAAGSPAAGAEERNSVVIVTATRRREPAREVPMQLDVLSADTLQRAGARTLTDYLSDQPGIDVKTTGGAGTGAINVRGVSTGDQTISTVSTYIDDVAVGSSSAYAAGATTALDMSLLDLHHIELLRGPQGTLYGAGAMGGLMKYVTNQPHTDEFSGEVSVGMTQTKGGASGNTGSAVLNIPIKEDVAAFRVSLFRDRVGGFIDAGGPVTKSNINGGVSTGARVSVLVEPSKQLTLRLTATEQEIKRDGSDYVDYDIATGTRVNPGFARKLRVEEPYSVKASVVTADIEYDFGWGRFNSISSSQESHFRQQSDYSYIYGPLVGLDSVIANIHASVKKETQEFRLTSQTGGQFEWLAGFFYDHEEGTNHQTDTGATDGDLLAADLPSSYRESALYGNATWNASKRFAVTVGMRYAKNRQDFAQLGGGLLVGGQFDLHGRSAETSKTYLATAKYAITPVSNVYLRAASGYRPGGPNAVVLDGSGQPVAPTTFKHDSIWSYEGGYKADLLAKSLSIQAALYLIRWDQIQQFYAVNGVNVVVNGGKARSQGAELSAKYRPSSHLSVSASLAYNDAHLTEDAPGLAASGARLPNAARVSGNIGANYGFAVAGHEAYVGLSQRLVGGRNAGFDGSDALPNYKLPGYGLTDVQAGVDLDRFQIALFVRNLLDKRAQLGAETNLVEAGSGGPVLVNEARPISFGFTVKAIF